MARLNIFKKVKPFQYVKKFLPATFLGRALVIVIAPVVLIQVITALVFWERHWTNTTETLALTLAGDISFLWHMAEERSGEAPFFQDLQTAALKHHSISLWRSPLEEGFSKDLLKKVDWKGDFLKEALDKKLAAPFLLRLFRNQIIVQVIGQKYIYSFEISKKFLFPKTIPIVLWWEIGAPLFFLLIAIFFMRNQVRPLKTLATAMEAFGKGQEVPDLKPAGGLEVRQVGRAFNAMRERLRKQMTQRTEMLAGISHDLRTPLTRMELQLALFPEVEAKKALLEDVKDMEKMLEEYLAFAKGQEIERPVAFSLIGFLEDLLKKFSSDQVEVTTSQQTLQNIRLMARPYALRRAFKNLIMNGIRYGQKVWIQVTVTPRSITLIFEDAGPGIPLEKREEVFRPFVRLDDSRNTDTGGYGLGLSIARDILLSHGGNIFLEESLTHGGLKAIVHLPR